MVVPSLEFLCRGDEGRKTILPIRHSKLWKWNEQFRALTWFANEVPLVTDYSDWTEKMSAGDRAFYTPIWAFLAQADELIGKNLSERFLSEFKIMEVIHTLMAQAFMEQEHAVAYSQIVETLYPDEAEREKVIESVEHIPVVGAMFDWVERWITSDEPIGARLAAFAIFEGCMFQGHFLAIQLLKMRNLLPGVTRLNELIQRDEGRHCLFGCFLLMNYVEEKPSVARVRTIVNEAFGLFSDFIRYACNEARKAEGLPMAAPCPVKNITEAKMEDYVRSVFDAVCADMNYPLVFGVPNPYPEAGHLALNDCIKANQFEVQSTLYSVKFVNNFDAARLERCQTAGFCSVPVDVRETLRRCRAGRSSAGKAQGSN